MGYKRVLSVVVVRGGLTDCYLGGPSRYGQEADHGFLREVPGPLVGRDRW